ncbi:MAG: methylmalonyl-CoA mutase family protein, partial [Dehalococcoidales bacterium]|nr:methylmalonyl-CoA mutase family protein [Dehalococcoidales bacterium]
GVPLKELSGIICNGGLRGYMGLQIPVFPPQGNLRMVVDTIEYCTRNMPNFIPTNMVGDMCEAGATPVQEVAFGLSMFKEIIRASLKKGLFIDEFAPTFAGWYTITLGEFFEQIAKVRALRRLWAKMMKEEFGAKDPKSWRLKVSSHTPGGSVLTREEPLNNIARVAIAILGNVLAGVQAIHSCSYDEGYDIPTREASLVSLRTQQIIEEEIGVKDVADPLGGSYFLETLTNQIEEKVNNYIKKIEEMGGYIAAIENGYIQQEITNAAYQQQQELETGKRVIVGVNKYHSDVVNPIELVKRNPKTKEIVIKRLQEVKKTRDSSAVKESLEKIKEAATGGKNLMPFFIEAVKNYTTMGEITLVLKEVFGEYDTSHLGKLSTC